MGCVIQQGVEIVSYIISGSKCATVAGLDDDVSHKTRVPKLTSWSATSETPWMPRISDDSDLPALSQQMNISTASLFQLLRRDVYVKLMIADTEIMIRVMMM